MFYYELHSHTCTASLCSVVEPEDFVQFYIDKGYSGMVITDHFYHGNTAINRRLPWEEFVDRFCEGFYRVKSVGDERGFTVLFGFEQKFSDGSDEYIVLGISPEWLKAHPEIRDMKREPFFELIRGSSGFVIQAHPFRERYYISDIRLSLDRVDAIEVFNIGDSDEISRRSIEYARNLSLPVTGGTDVHSIEGRDEVGGVALEREIFTVEELIKEIKEGRARPAPLERFEKISAMPLSRDIDLEVYCLRDGILTITDDHFAEEYGKEKL